MCTIFATSVGKIGRFPFSVILRPTTTTPPTLHYLFIFLSLICVTYHAFDSVLDKWRIHLLECREWSIEKTSIRSESNPVLNIKECDVASVGQYVTHNHNIIKGEISLFVILLFCDSKRMNRPTKVVVSTEEMS